MRNSNEIAASGGGEGRTGGRSDGADAVNRTPASGLDLTPGEMRRLGYAVVDLLMDRYAGLREGPVWQGGRRGELEALLREPPPQEGRNADEVLERAVSQILPRAGRIDHPRFLAFVPSSPTWPSVLADFLTTGFNIFQGTWLESAGPSQVELVVLDWFREWLGLPDSGGGVLTSGGSAANLGAMLVAREVAGNPDSPVVYMSDQGHSSLERAARIVGVPAEAVRKLPTDRHFRLDARELERALQEDRAGGRSPMCVCASAGATNTGAVDPLKEIAGICGEHDVWFHVDGAYGGFAILTERGKDALRGIELADSVTLDPHKWLFQPYETGCLMVRDTSLLEAAFRILPEYLQDVDLGMEHVNFADRGLQLTRSFRALKIWMSIQILGLDAFGSAIDEAMDIAGEAERHIRASDELELLSPATLGVVCFRYRPAALDDARELETLNARIQDRIVESGFAMMSSTRLLGEYSLRLCILNYRTKWDDVRETLQRIEATGRDLTGGG